MPPKAPPRLQPSEAQGEAVPTPLRPIGSQGGLAEAYHDDATAGGSVSAARRATGRRSAWCARGCGHVFQEHSRPGDAVEGRLCPGRDRLGATRAAHGTTRDGRRAGSSQLFRAALEAIGGSAARDAAAGGVVRARL